MEGIRDRNFSYIGCLLWSIWQKLSAWSETNTAASKVIAESMIEISTATREMPQLPGVFLLKINTNHFILNRDDPNCTWVILLSKYLNHTPPNQPCCQENTFLLSHLFLLLLVHSLFLPLLSIWSEKSLSSKELAFSLMFWNHAWPQTSGCNSSAPCRGERWNNVQWSPDFLQSPSIQIERLTYIVTWATRPFMFSTFSG